MSHNHLVNHIRHHELKSDQTLHVIGVCTNPVRYHSRYRLFREWKAAMTETPNVKVYGVEAAFGDRHHEVTESNEGQDLQLRTHSEIWIKENMINLGVKYLLPRDWKYMAWVDADVFFRDPYWARETLHQLQHYSVVQPWSDCADLGPLGNISRHFRSFGYQHQRRKPKQMHPTQPYEYAHSGFAWACRRDFFEAANGLLDFAILGSADHHMAFAMIGEVKNTIHRGMSPGFFRRCFEFQDRVRRVTKDEVGFTPGRIEHMFHGPKARRYYRERWQLLVDSGFDPDTDLMYDPAGVIQLIGKPRLEQAIKMYNRSRFEDSIEES